MLSANAIAAIGQPLLGDGVLRASSINAFMFSPPAASAKSLAFGNLRSYTIRDALEVMLYRFTDSAYAKLGQIGFMAIARAGGNLADTGAVKLYQHSAT